MRLQLDPGRGERVRQQRPRRDHARALHGAEIARSADPRPGLRAVPDRQRPRRNRRGLLRVPVPLPQRPEPDRGASAASPGTDAAAAAAARRPARHPRPRAVHPLQPADRGLGRRRPTTSTIDAGRVASGDGAPIGAAKDVGIRADRADGFVLRNVKVRHAAEHDIYVLETDGYLLDRFKAFYARRVRRADVRRGPRPDAELRGGGQRRLGPVPGRRRRDRQPARHEHLPRVPLQPGDPRLRLAPQHRRLLGHRRQRHARRTTTTSTTTRSASRPTSSPPPGTPASRRTPT